jgi:hypothetical protein
VALAGWKQTLGGILLKGSEAQARYCAIEVGQGAYAGL